MTGENREDTKRKRKGVEMAEGAEAHRVYDPVLGALMLHLVSLLVIGTEKLSGVSGWRFEDDGWPVRICERLGLGERWRIGEGGRAIVMCRCYLSL